MFGTILEGSIELDLWNILDKVVRPAGLLAVIILNALGYMVDHFILSLDFAVAGVVTVSISSSNSALTLNTTELTFSEEELSHIGEISPTDTSVSEIDFVIGDVSYGLNFAADWVVKFGFKSPVSLFVGVLLGLLVHFLYCGDRRNVQRSANT